MKVVQEVDQQKWSNFVYGHPNGNIFQTPEMYDVYMNTKNYEPILLAVLSEDNEILGILLAVLQKEYPGILGNLTARSIIYGGPIIKNNEIEILKIILKEYDKIIRRKAIYSQFRNLWELSNMIQIFDSYGYKYEPWFNYIIDLSIGKDKLFSNLSASKRLQIRKSIKNGLKITENVTSEDFNIFYKTLSDFYNTFVKKPLPPIDFFQSINKFLSKKGLSKYFLIKHNEKVVGGILCLIIPNRSIYEFYVYGLKEFKNIYPSVLATWAPIAWGSENNLKYFDFMGAGSPKQNYGVREFKSKFGGKLVNYGRYEKIHKPFLMELGKFGLKLWQRLR